MKLQLLIILLLSTTLVDAALREDLNELANNYPQLDTKRIKLFLPVRAQLKTLDTNENLFLILNKNGKLEVKDYSKRVDLIIIGKEEDIRTLLNTQDYEQISNMIPRFRVQTKSFKGAILITLLEKELNTNLITGKTIYYKLANFITGLFFAS